MFKRINGIFSTYLKENIAYKADFFFSGMIAPLVMVINILVWSAVFKTSDNVGGYGLAEMITYLLFATLTQSYTYSNVAEFISQQIEKGDFLVFLLKPFSFMKLRLWNHLSRKFAVMVIETLPVIVIIILFFREYFIFGHVVLFILSVFFASIISYFLYFMVGLISFYLTKSRTLKWMLELIIGIGAGYYVPVNLFPDFIQSLLNILPFKYIIYVPVNIYLGNYSLDISMGFESVYYALGIQVFWIVFLFLFSGFMYRLAVRKFSGVGA